MKHINLSSILLVFSLLILFIQSSCYKGKGELVTEELTLPDLEGIILRTSDLVIIQQSTEQSVMVTAQQNVIDQLNLDVENGVWDIEFDRLIRSYEDMTIVISAGFLSSIRLTSSGRIETDGAYIMQKAFINVDGSGDIEMDVDVDEKLNMGVSGSGNLVVRGSAMSSKVTIPGSGSVFSYGVDTDDVEVVISGSGNAEVFADKQLDVTITGSGNVYYKGFPTITQNITGSGELFNEN